MFLILLFLIIPLLTKSEKGEIEEDLVNLYSSNIGRGLSSYQSTTKYDYGVIYFRFNWDTIEPTTKGVINWSNIDNRIATAKAEKKLVALRLQTHGGPPTSYPHKVPDWLYNKLGDGNGEWWDSYWYPNYNNEVFLLELERIISEFGKKYDDNKIMMYIDIGSVGMWGEWHLGQLPSRGSYMPTYENGKRIVDAYINAFKNVPLVMLIADYDVCDYAVSKGAGIRCDCFGDWSDDGWNHMEDKYPETFPPFMEAEKWKTRLVVVEPCAGNGIIDDYNKGYDLTKTFQFVFDWHLSSYNNKGGTIPSEIKDEMDQTIKKMGYRFVVRDFESKLSQKRGDKWEFFIETKWENVGIAPIFFDAKIEWILTIGEDSKHTFTSSYDVKTFLPNSPQNVKDSFPFTDVIIKNDTTYNLDLCMTYKVDDNTKFYIGIAIQNERKDECYRLVDKGSIKSYNVVTAVVVPVIVSVFGKVRLSKLLQKWIPKLKD